MNVRLFVRLAAKTEAEPRELCQRSVREEIHHVRALPYLLSVMFLSHSLSVTLRDCASMTVIGIKTVVAGEGKEE